VHKITITATIAVILLKLPAGSFTKISDGREISNDWATRVKSSLKSLQSGCSLVFLLEQNINVTDHVISEIITNIEALDLAKFVQFFKNILVKFFKMLLDLVRVKWLTLSIDARSNHVRTLVHVG
jgi:hypothetical protein